MNSTDSQTPYPLGVTTTDSGIRFSFVSESPDCGILLYERASGRCLEKIPFQPGERMGKVYTKLLSAKQLHGLKNTEIAWQFYREEKIVCDERAGAYIGTLPYGKPRCKEKVLAAFPLTEDFTWESDKRPGLSYEDCIVYCMHVRGFTRHSSSKVGKKGTFSGIIEKIDYLKQSGFTTLELQPAYEFDELPDDGSCAPSRLNYWGYCKGFYYAPKAAYASANAAKEMKELVKALHQKGMELILQMYFPEDVNVLEIPVILRFWVSEYHVDGFHLLGATLPADLIASDPALSDTKLWYYHFDTTHIYGKGTEVTERNLAECKDDFLYAARKFLKGDEGILSDMLSQMRFQPDCMGRIHYMTNYNGFTLYDLVSYDRKHNEDNGEENRDGSDYNFSWNCGEEGETRKKNIRKLRIRQIKNAMCLLLLSQSTPMVFMGDEFGNSQKGNNNPYCQDNGIAWLDWRCLDKNRELYDFWCGLTQFRREHPILHGAKQLRLMDYAACGYPDLSYHGENAWQPALASFDRKIGIMYCGKYAHIDRMTEDDFLYIAINMHWEPHELGLPKLPNGMRWEIVLDTLEDRGTSESNLSAGLHFESSTSSTIVAARSIKVLKSVPCKIKNEKEKKLRKKS